MTSHQAWVRIRRQRDGPLPRNMTGLIHKILVHNVFPGFMLIFINVPISDFHPQILETCYTLVIYTGLIRLSAISHVWDQET